MRLLRLAWRCLFLITSKRSPRTDLWLSGPCRRATVAPPPADEGGPPGAEGGRRHPPKAAGEPGIQQKSCNTRIFASRRFAPNVDLPKACQKPAEGLPKVCRRLRQGSAKSQKSVGGGGAISTIASASAQWRHAETLIYELPAARHGLASVYWSAARLLRPSSTLGSALALAIALSSWPRSFATPQSWRWISRTTRLHTANAKPSARRLQNCSPPISCKCSRSTAASWATEGCAPCSRP